MTGKNGEEATCEKLMTKTLLELSKISVIQIQKQKQSQLKSNLITVKL
jgi:hypothetical protein